MDYRGERPPFKEMNFQLEPLQCFRRGWERRL
jgi:hypothetical protein